MAMAISTKIPEKCAVQLLLSYEEGEFLRTVLGAAMSSERSNGKWSRIHDDLYETISEIIRYSNTEIDIKGMLAIKN